MARDAIEEIKLRRNFYRDSYRVIVYVLMIAVLVIAILAGSIFYLLTHRPEPKYFATTSSGKLIPMIPLDKPNLNDKSILLWVSNAVTSIYTYDFLNYRSTFQNNSQYFTKGGWKAFLQQLTSSNNLKAVEQKKLTVQAVPAGAPVITKQGVYRGRYYWRVQLPLLITYESLSEQFNQRLLLTLTVERLSTLDNPYGVGIAQIVEQQQG